MRCAVLPDRVLFFHGASVHDSCLFHIILFRNGPVRRPLPLVAHEDTCGVVCVDLVTCLGSSETCFLTCCGRSPTDLNESCRPAVLVLLFLEVHVWIQCHTITHNVLRTVFDTEIYTYVASLWLRCFCFMAQTTQFGLSWGCLPFGQVELDASYFDSSFQNLMQPPAPGLWLRLLMDLWVVWHVESIY